MGMGVRQGGCQLVPDTNDISEWYSGGLPDQGAQIGRAKKFHDEKLGPLMFFDGIDGDDIVVLKPGHRTGFSHEPLCEGGIATQVGMDLLDGDDAMQGAVESFIDYAHSATGDFLLYDVFSCKNL